MCCHCRYYTCNHNFHWCTLFLNATVFSYYLSLMINVICISQFISAHTCTLLAINMNITQLPSYPVTQLPSYPVTKLPSYPVTQLPSYTKLPSYLVTKLPSYPVTKLPIYPVTQLPSYKVTQLPGYCAPNLSCHILNINWICINVLAIMQCYPQKRVCEGPKWPTLLVTCLINSNYLCPHTWPYMFKHNYS